MVKIKSLNDLNIDMLEVYEQLRNGKIEKSTAKSLAAVAGKVIELVQPPNSNADDR